MEDRRLSAVPTGLAPFLSQVSEEILAEWRSRMSVLPHARVLSPAALIDHMPAVLAQVAALVDEIANRQPVEHYFETARAHARQRLGEGFDITEVVQELSVL